MVFSVSEDCIGCGACASVCPEVFSMTGIGTAVACPLPQEGRLADNALEALDTCPVGAISYN